MREDQAACDRMAVHGRHDGPREPVPAGEDGVDPLDHPALAVGVECRSDLQVSSGREEALAAGQDDGSRRIGDEFVGEPAALLEQLRVHRVRRRPVDPDYCDVFVAKYVQIRVGVQRFPAASRSTRSAPSASRPMPWSQRSTPRAHWRPSLIPQTISDCPRRASPAANTPGTELM